VYASVIYENSAESKGGGIENWGQMTVNNSAIYGNPTDNSGAGGGIWD
jgi:hypothetical protein